MTKNSITATSLLRTTSTYSNISTTRASTSLVPLESHCTYEYYRKKVEDPQ